MNSQFNFNNGSNVYFTSDTHFGHTNILKFCSRPFKDVTEMNRKLIENWNSKVPKDGIVFHLGDFQFGGSSLFQHVFPQLNGHIHLILGNHDVKNIQASLLSQFASVHDQLQIVVENRPIYLNHYPFLCYGGTYRNAKSQVWQLFGHVHTCKHDNTGQDFDRLSFLLPTQYDVGVDFNDYTPISFSEVNEKITKQVENNQNMLNWIC